MAPGVPTSQGPRLPWDDVPEPVREGVAAVLGSPVVSATTQLGGFSPGAAVRAGLADGRRVFVKACGAALNPDSPDLIRAEAVALSVHPDPPGRRGGAAGLGVGLPGRSVAGHAAARRRRSSSRAAPTPTSSSGRPRRPATSPERTCARWSPAWSVSGPSAPGDRRRRGSPRSAPGRRTAPRPRWAGSTGAGSGAEGPRNDHASVIDAGRARRIRRARAAYRALGSRRG